MTGPGRPSGPDDHLLVIVIGLALLVRFGVHIGTQLDSSAQRRARQRLADERRLLDDFRRTGVVVRRCDPDELCSNCPFR